ncbi:unnamed protein product [Oikopleura dioica]|uniref:Uncharacterized protein n=1 Tax=Oikopleura dioica TaxID=34765 RepID=E4X9B5_OIKDI|nr:unnamed protein product [Oikopleura dioica]
MCESYQRETCSQLTQPTEIPAEADGTYVLEVIKNNRKKHLIKTNLYRPHKSPKRPDNLFPKVPVSSMQHCRRILLARPQKFLHAPEKSSINYSRRMQSCWHQP